MTESVKNKRSSLRRSGGRHRRKNPNTAGGAALPEARHGDVPKTSRQKSPADKEQAEDKRRAELDSFYGEAGRDVVVTGLDRLRKRWKTWGGLALRIHCSVSKIQAWREGRQRIYPKDAIRLAINDDGTLASDLDQRAGAWLGACGHAWEQAKIKDEVSKMTNLDGLIEQGLREVRDVAELKGLAQTDLDMALSCKLGQKRLSEDLEDWLIKTNGVGTTAFFWRWDDKLPKRFEQKQTRDTIKYLVKALSRDASQGVGGGKEKTPIPGLWKPPGKQSDLKVIFLIQVNVDASESAATKTRLTEIEESFRSSLQLDLMDAARVEFRYATERFPHPSDCLVCTCADRSFACLVSESNRLMAKVLTSKVEEMVKAPWLWCVQVILVEGADNVNREYLKIRDVGLELDGLLNPGKKWVSLDRLFLTEEPKK